MFYPLDISQIVGGILVDVIVQPVFIQQVGDVYKRQHVRSQFPMYEVESIERKTDTLDGKETDYLYVTLKTS